MREYVEEMGPQPCDAASGENCDAKQTAFVATWTGKTGAQRAAELARLTKIGATLVATPEVTKWHRQRMAILKQLVHKDEL